jgi:autotransporter-associated beta strand protein
LNNFLTVARRASYTPSTTPLSATMQKTLLALAVMCAASHAFAQTAFTGTYTFTGTTGTNNPFSYNGTDIANLTEGALSRTTNLPVSSSSGNFRATGFALDASLGTLTGTNDPTKYFEFSLTAASGFTLSMTNINFGVGRSGTGARTFAWASSVDSFAAIITNYSSLGSSGQLTNNNGAVSIITDSTPTTATNVVLDLSGASFQNLTSITFRFYGWNGESAAGTAGLQGPLSFSGSLLNTNPVTGGSYWAADPAGGGSGTWTSGGTTWATNTGGAGAGQTQSSSTLNFADTAGTVTVSGGVSVSNGMTFQTTGYTVQGSGTVTLAGTAIANNAITTDTGVTTTISSELAGTTGMTKSGSGTLVVSGANSFSGNASITAGTLQITNDAALGNTANDLANNGTLKTTTSVSLAAGRDISGSGTFDIANGTTLTVNGNVNNTATTLNNTGTFDLQGAARSLGALSLNAPGTINAAGAINVTTLTTSGLTNGTATINPDVVFTTGVKTLNVAAGGELALNGAVSGASTIAKTGAGTLSINSSNSSQIRVGATAASPTDGGTVVLASAASTGSGQIQLNYGTLRAASAIVATNGLSIGGRAGSAALLAGSNMEFQGQSTFFRGTSTSGQMVLNVDNTTTFSGGFAAIGGSGTATGITLGGAGAVVISGSSSALVENFTLTNSVKFTLNNSLGGGVSVGADNAFGGTGTVGGALSLAAGADFIVFDLNSALTVTGAVTLDNTFSIGSLLGANGAALDWSSVADGTYTLINSTSSFSNIQNFGEGNKTSIGGDRFAYFSEGSLQLNVVPEPSTYALLVLSAAGLGAHMIRRRRR